MPPRRRKSKPAPEAPESEVQSGPHDDEVELGDDLGKVVDAGPKEVSDFVDPDEETADDRAKKSSSASLVGGDEPDNTVARADEDLLIERPELGPNAWTQVIKGEPIPRHLVGRERGAGRRGSRRRKS